MQYISFFIVIILYTTKYIALINYTHTSGDHMGKRIKKRMKLRTKIRITLLLIIFILSFIYTIKYLDKINIGSDNDIFLKQLIDDSSNIKTKHSNKTTGFIKYIANINLFDPVSIINSNYAYLLKESEGLSDNDEEEKVEKTSNYINNPNPDEVIKDPIVYIYNTHQREDYRSSNTANYNITPNVMMASYVLKERLNKLKIPSIVEENNVSEILRINSWNYASSYKVTRLMLEQAIKDEPTLKYFIDLHRDSISRKLTTLETNNKKYAKILFVIGLENKNYEKNLKMSETLHNYLNKELPGISKGIYKKKGKYVNGIYNQDFNPNTILVELGGNENTIEEAVNTIEILSKVISKYIGEQND